MDMGRGFKIGQVLGITIRVDWSWLIIFALVAWNLSAVFGSAHPNWTTGKDWSLAIGAAILFFASVLAHELAHSLVARARGMPVRNITLFLFGGVSNIQREPSSPRAEFVMAIVGPLTSVVLGVVLLALALALGGPLPTAVPNATSFVGRLNAGVTLLLWLGSINVILGVFNMIPGFPLDGGRVLRSILWAIVRDLRRATRWAAWVGQGIGWLMIVAGIAMVFGIQIPFFGTGLLSGLWLAFIGWFLSNSASQSYRQVVIRDVLGDVAVQQVMRRNPPTVPAGITVGSLIHDYVMTSDDSAFPVLDNGQIRGLVTLQDVRAVPREAWETTSIEDIMSPIDRLVAVTPEENAADALDKLARRDVRQLPVLQDGGLVGLLRRQDIVRWLQIHSDGHGYNGYSEING
jgi:Zn-dependent protease/predicted transcriptional regulator